jgi:hypothetical protein
MGTGDAAGQGGVNNPRAVADPANAKGDPIPRPASCLPIGAESNAGRHMRVVSRRVAALPAEEANVASPLRAPRPVLARKQNPVSRTPRLFITVFGPSSRSGDWSPRLSPCSALLHSGIALHYSQTYPSFFSDPCMLVQESEGDRAEEAQLASTFGRCHETNSDNVITTRYCITAHTRRRTSCQIARQSNNELVAR